MRCTGEGTWQKCFQVWWRHWVKELFPGVKLGQKKEKDPPAPTTLQRGLVVHVCNLTYSKQMNHKFEACLGNLEYLVSEK